MIETRTFLDGRVVLYGGDCREALDLLEEETLDGCVTDPPYHLTSIVRRFGADGAAPAQFGTDGAFARASAGFMGQQWDGGDVAFQVETWRKVYRVLKPGAHLVAFSGTRTYHRMACAIEDAGFEIRDMIAWLYGSGFPKNHAVPGAIDDHLFGVWLDADPARREAYRVEMASARSLPTREGRVKSAREIEARWRALGGFQPTVISEGAPLKRMIPGADQHKGGWEKNDGAEYRPRVELAATAEAREWDGWGTALKPALEPICFARKPLAEKTIAANVLKFGTGGINVDAARVDAQKGDEPLKWDSPRGGIWTTDASASASASASGVGRYPANVVHDGSAEVVAAFPAEAGARRPVTGRERSAVVASVYGERDRIPGAFHADSGSAARFFYSAKADLDDRVGSKHPTIKPVDLKRWLVRVIIPKGGRVLDPFAGTGTTGEAAILEGMNATLVELTPAYRVDIAERMAATVEGRTMRRARIHKRKKLAESAGPLFEDKSS